MTELPLKSAVLGKLSTYICILLKLTHFFNICLTLLLAAVKHHDPSTQIAIGSLLSSLQISFKLQRLQIICYI